MAVTQRQFHRLTEKRPLFIVSRLEPQSTRLASRRAQGEGALRVALRRVRRPRMEMNENLLYEAAFRKVEQAGQVVNFMDYAAAFDAAVACKYSRRSRCPPPSTLYTSGCCVTLLSMSAEISLGCSCCCAVPGSIVDRGRLGSTDDPWTSPWGARTSHWGVSAAVCIGLRPLDAQLKYGCVQRICEQIHQLWAVGHLRQRR